MKSTTDIWFASFLIELRGYKLHDYHVIARGRGRFNFKISDEDWKREKMLFMQSDVSKLKQGQEKLKDLLF